MTPVRSFNQLSYEAADVGSWSFVGSSEPVRSAWIKDEMINELYYTLNRGCENQISYDLRYERTFCKA